MPSEKLRARALPGAITRRKIKAALRACGMPLAPADEARLKRVPGDVLIDATLSLSAIGSLSDGDTLWVWLETGGKGDEGAAGAGGQIVLRLPPGRYLVDTLDVNRRAWIARESAAGDPLVAGIPAACHQLLLRVKRISGEQQTPAGDE